MFWEIKICWGICRFRVGCLFKMYFYIGKKSFWVYWFVYVFGIVVSFLVKVFLEVVEDVLDVFENIKVEVVIEF